MDMIVNPLEARALGRALTWSVEAKLEAPVLISRTMAPVIAYKGDRRAILCYSASACEKHYLIGVAGDKFFWDQAEVVEPDGQEHHVWVTYVLEQGYPERLSRSNAPARYERFAREQVALGISRGDPRYVHPLDRRTKDVFILHLLQGTVFHTASPGLDGIVCQFMLVEQQTRDLEMLERT